MKNRFEVTVEKNISGHVEISVTEDGQNVDLSYASREITGVGANCTSGVFLVGEHDLQPVEGIYRGEIMEKSKLSEMTAQEIERLIKKRIKHFRRFKKECKKKSFKHTFKL